MVVTATRRGGCTRPADSFPYTVAGHGLRQRGEAPRGLELLARKKHAGFPSGPSGK
jgi:hypothetical protein